MNYWIAATDYLIYNNMACGCGEVKHILWNVYFVLGVLMYFIEIIYSETRTSRDHTQFN